MSPKLKLAPIILILFCQYCFAQDINAPTNGRTVFAENFSNNKNGWPVQSGENYSFSIHDSQYDMNSSLQRMIALGVNIPFDHHKDYSISCELSHLSGPDYNGFGLTFSQKDANDKYQLQLATQGYYRVIRYQKDNIIQIIPWTASAVIEKEDGKINKLLVQKKGKTCNIYINDSLINSFEDFDNEGNQTGFVIENQQHVVATSLMVQYN